MTSVSLVLGLCGSTIAECAESAEGVILGTVWVLALLSAVFLVVGVSYLLSVLYARGLSDAEREDTGTVFFGDIAPLGLEKYRERVFARDDDRYIKEITEQIHVNAMICVRKYQHYDKGMVLSVSGVLFLIILSMVSIIF